MRRYRQKEWASFRKEVLELDKYTCVRCRRSESEGVVLQVHHKEYLPGKAPWEYPYNLCETLCKGCHASEHGVIQPFVGWTFGGHEDLGDLSGECDLCGNTIRHVFRVDHEKWPSMDVGEICCDYLTATTLASDHMDSIKRSESRKLRFIESSRWKFESSGKSRIKQKGAEIIIEPIEQSFRLVVNDVAGRRHFSSVIDAKKFVFEIFENGEIEKFLLKHSKSNKRR